MKQALSCPLGEVLGRKTEDRGIELSGGCEGGGNDVFGLKSFEEKASPARRDNDVFGLESCKGKASGEEDEMR
jgi:hypothetical protein